MVRAPKTCLSCRKLYNGSERQKFCSRVCSRVGRRGTTTKKKLPMETRACLLCKKLFEVVVNSKKKYCGYKCYGYSRIGISRSEETRKAIGDSNRGKIKRGGKQREGQIKRFQDPKERGKAGLALKGRKLSETHKPDCPCCVCKTKRGETIGSSHWAFGKTYDEMYGVSGSKDLQSRLRLVHTGKRHSKETSEKNRMISLEHWKDPVYRDKVIKAVFKAMSIKPNKPEKFLTKFLDNLFPNEYKYVGDGSVLIGFKNPDFININGQKKIIEFNGDFWHSEKRTGRTKAEEENQRISHFAKYGYQTLIVWGNELKNIKMLVEKLKEFNSTKEK